MLRFVVEFTFLSCGIRCKSPRCEARAFLCAWVGVGIGIGIGRHDLSPHHLYIVHTDGGLRASRPTVGF